MNGLRRLGVLAAVLGILTFSPSIGAERVKDLGTWEGVRDNQLIGYGLVVGLAGTGDSWRTRMTVQSLSAMLGRLGIRVEADQIRVRNVAAVMVTAALPPFARPGSQIDVNVSSMGDAKSLVGGSLLMTPLEGPDGQIYAVAQGALVVGGFTSESNGTTVTKNHPTRGHITDGAIVERSVAVDLDALEELVFQLRFADFATAARLAEAMRGVTSGSEDDVRAIDAATVSVKVPEDRKGRVAPLIAELEALEVQSETAARVVVNERTGTVVFGSDVRISTVAVSHGALHVEVTGSRTPSQPAPFSTGGETVVVEESRVELREEPGQLKVVKAGVSLGELVDALNALGATPRDLIDILQAIKAAGALKADLVTL